MSADSFSKIRNQFKVLQFYLAGRKPWSKGYIEAREGLILEAMQSPPKKGEPLPKGFGKGFDERIVEIPWMYHALSNRKSCLWDVGSALNRKAILRQKKFMKKRIFISNLNPEARNFHQMNVSYIYEDVLQTVTQDGFFDEVVCISTLEHIGFNNQKYCGVPCRQKDPNLHLRAVAMFRKKLKPGGKALISVPFGKRSDHGWFQIFNEVMIQGIVARFAPAKSDLKIFHCTEQGWVHSDMKSSGKAGFHDWGKSRRGHGGIAGSEAVACLELWK